jgi:hypothetical protein
MRKVKSVFKWVGLYLLANLGGGVLGWGLGAGNYGAVFAAGIFAVMIVYAVMTREKKANV